MTMLTVRRLPYPPVSPVCFLPSNATNCRVSHLCTPSREVGDKSSVTPADPPTDRRQNAPPAFTSSFASNNPMEVDGTFTSVTPPAATVAAASAEGAKERAREGDRKSGKTSSAMDGTQAGGGRGIQIGRLRLMTTLRWVAKSVYLAIRGQNKHLNFFNFHTWMLRIATRQEESWRIALGGDHRQQSCDREGRLGQRPRAGGRTELQRRRRRYSNASE